MIIFELILLLLIAQSQWNYDIGPRRCSKAGSSIHPNVRAIPAAVVFLFLSSASVDVIVLTPLIAPALDLTIGCVDLADLAVAAFNPIALKTIMK